ncbi:Protein of unknown function (plasmid) [Azospirillum lipoferum 4B]|uniref:Uncharacterized protein n=1 Tax=Azospirillum lipoferum (strain 4B) TaxID=862719 RepID=G7ZII3_AZOL4|nr:Protein of unknown function [Azospirillum lipoferum 4B]
MRLRTRLMGVRSLDEAPLPVRERGWGEGRKSNISNDLRPPYPSSQPFSRKGRRALGPKVIALVQTQSA